MLDIKRESFIEIRFSVLDFDDLKNKRGREGESKNCMCESLHCKSYENIKTVELYVCVCMCVIEIYKNNIFKVN